MACSLAKYRAWLPMSEAAIRRKLGPGTQESQNVGYQRLSNLTQLYNPSVLPGRIYLQNGTVAMIYAGEDALEGCKERDLRPHLKGEGVMLPSRAGKSVTHHVYPKQGVAYSADHEGNVVILEIFSPRPIDAYKAEVYKEPGPFIR